jgi:hypothetical protein
LACAETGFMELLSEDPTYLAGGLTLLAVALLVALRITQKGTFLVGAGIALLLALAVLAIERLWVTDTERIERVVSDLRRAVERSDAEGVLAHLTPDVQYATQGHSIQGPAVRSFIQATLERAKFDFVRISNLKASVGGLSRRGQAEFRVFASGELDMMHGASGSDWSLGFVETSPKVWKVNRISPTRIPAEVPRPSGIPAPRRRFMLPQ